jgi:polyisoprenoid-binding protein YceI
MIKFFKFCLLITFSNLLFAVETYKIDSEHSFANWKIRHIVSKTSGSIPDISGQIIINRDDLSASSVNAELNLLSINSSHLKRDDHIQEKKFLDTANFSKIYFKSTRIDSKDNQTGTIYGELTMHGVTKSIQFPFTLLGFGPDPWGGYRMGVEGHTKIKASDYGYSWGLKENASLGDDIEINLLIEGIRQ